MGVLLVAGGSTSLSKVSEREEARYTVSLWCVLNRIWPLNDQTLLTLESSAKVRRREWLEAVKSS